MQAIVNAAAHENEFVKEFLINEAKYTLLVRDLLATEVWREKVFRLLLDMKYEPKLTFPIYMVVSVL